uniref:Uncharacterized protein n=2 Tax=Rhizochromulina marina TaxID=1034831 RepID=A0A7S2W3E4_9STRA|mmetsp:Transcript_12970/g.37732  ORF Transcript_12970/g.37732 Transcript_12970/m.37732 type:complete len:176 (+) Transcript_12970:941-1468(+)
MALFNLTVDEFHGMWNLGNAGYYVLEMPDPTAGFLLSHPIRAGGLYPPLPVSKFLPACGVTTEEPSTWGVAMEELEGLWKRHSVDGHPPRSPDDHLTPEATTKFLHDIVDLAYPRLLAAGYVTGKEDVSSWAEKLWSLYLYDKNNQAVKSIAWRHVRRVVLFKGQEFGHVLTAWR